jgi:hypothetical protein
MPSDNILSKLRATPRILGVLLLWSLGNSAAGECLSDSKFIHFNFDRIVETETETRYLRTDAQFNNRGFIQYTHDDEVVGSVNAVAIDHNDYYVDHGSMARYARNWYTVDGIRRLIKGLAHRGFYELKSGPQPVGFEYPVKYSVSLYVSCGESKHSVSYFSERDAAPAARVIELMQRYLDRRLRLRAVKKSRMESESDAAPPLKINIVKLLRNPKLYHGKRVKVSGDFVQNLENVSLADTGIPKIRVWVDSTPSTFGSVAELEPYGGARVSMEGIFVTGRRGHFGMWKGELKRVTKVERVE